MKSKKTNTPKILPDGPILREAPILPEGPTLNTSPKVLVTGFFDLLNSGQVSFLREAAKYGDLYVGVGSDRTFEELKGRQPVCSEQERLYMVKAVRHVKDAFINSGSGILDFLAELDRLQPDILVVNRDAADDLKRRICAERGIKYISIGAGGAVSAAEPQYKYESIGAGGAVSAAKPQYKYESIGAGGAVSAAKPQYKYESIGAQGAVSAAEPQYGADEIYCKADTAEPILREAPILRSNDTARSANTAKPILRSNDTAKPILPEGPILSRLPYRIDIAGTWIDQPYVSEHGSGWAITASIEPTYEFMERGGMSTSTRNAAKKIWPIELPAYNEEMLARLLFCFENDPENEGHVSGAQDAIGICISGLSRHYYDGHYWPERIETVHDEEILSWLENHVCVVPMFPRRPGCSVVEGKDITPLKVKALTEAASRCWDAILAKDLPAFAAAFRDSFEAQVAMFPAMMQPGVQEWIDRIKPHALAWKMLGAGGGGHLLLAVETIPDFAIPVRIRRRD